MSDTFRKKVLVIGCSGQLGKELVAALQENDNFDTVAATHTDIDITDSKSVNACFSLVMPNIVVNCAAYTAVDKAEDDVDRCYEVNAGGTRNIAEACAALQACLIHVSTDYVYADTSSSPCDENHPLDPKSIYGRSKLTGECAAMFKCSDTVILRTSWLYSPHGSNFVKTILRIAQENNTIRVVNDQIGSPTNAADLAQAIVQIMESGKFVAGVYNYSNSGAISWYTFAKAIVEYAGLDNQCTVEPISSSEYPTRAIRPKYSALDCSKIAATYGVKIMDWSKSLQKLVDTLAKNH